MSTFSEHTENENPKETRLQREDTIVQMYVVLKHFDLLPSKLDRLIFKYNYVYLISLLFLAELLTLLLLPSLSPQFSVRLLILSGLNVLFLVTCISVLLTFHVWRLRTPKTLRDLVEKKHITLPTSDTNQSYLRFLEHYRHALASQKKYFVSGLPMILFIVFGATYTVQYLIPEFPPNIFVFILSLVSYLLFSLFYLGGIYCLGTVTWTELISGWYFRKLVRTFALSIQPFHPDKCGGLKLLGNFYFGLVSPQLIGFGLIFGQLLFFLYNQFRIDAVLLALNGGFLILLSLLLALVYAFAVIVLAFMLPLWEIHTKMVSEGDRDEDTYVARIEALREEIQSLLDTNRVEEAKEVQEKKVLVETLHMPYPSWPFRFHLKIISTILGVSGSLLLGVTTAALQQYFLPAILRLFFHIP